MQEDRLLMAEEWGQGTEERAKRKGGQKKRAVLFCPQGCFVSLSQGAPWQRTGNPGRLPGTVYLAPSFLAICRKVLVT